LARGTDMDIHSMVLTILYYLIIPGPRRPRRLPKTFPRSSENASS
jgi:hypothetical protein